MSEEIICDTCGNAINIYTTHGDDAGIHCLNCWNKYTPLQRLAKLKQRRNK